MGSYILVIWTVVAVSGQYNKNYDWRPMGEFTGAPGYTSSKVLCEDAARTLAIPTEKYRCIKSKL